MNVMEAEFGIANAHCPTCAATLEHVLQTLPGVERASVELASARVAVAFDDQVITERELVQALDSGGFRITREAV